MKIIPKNELIIILVRGCPDRQYLEEQPTSNYLMWYSEGFTDGKKSIGKGIYERLRDICNEEIKKIDDERGEST